MFGAYTHCKWPKDVGSGKAPVADPSGHSFLFSLTNVTGKVVRFSLRDKNQALTLSTGVYFGYSGHPFALNCGHNGSDCGDGNRTWPLNEKSNYQPDDGDFTRGVDFFAGSQDFAAADIEVYEL